MLESLSQKLTEAVEKMPAFPESVHRVIQLTSDINCSAKDLVKVIELDPVMTAKILRLVNSPYFGLSREILNINHAVVYVGLNTVKNLALSIATIGALPHRNKAGFDIRRFLLHSLATAAIAKRLAQMSGAPETELNDYFVAGLLHDFGKAVLAIFMPEEFKLALDKAKEEAIPLHEAERAVIGTDHAEIGAMLCEQWGLPESLASATRSHHAPDTTDSLKIHCVFTANQVAKHHHYGESGNPVVEPFPPAVEARFGEFEALIENLGDLTPELKKVAIFITM